MKTKTKTKTKTVSEKSITPVWVWYILLIGVLAAIIGPILTEVEFKHKP